MDDQLMNSIQQEIAESIQTKQKLLADHQLLGNIEQAAQVCLNSFQQGGKIMLAGNGGSAADAQHMPQSLLINYVLIDRH